MATSWVETTSVGTLKSEDLAKADLVFRYNRYVYRTSGTHLSNGGMGTVYELDRRDDETGAEERVVGKVFHSSYLYQLRTDEVTRRDHHNNLAAMARIAAIEHPNILRRTCRRRSPTTTCSSRRAWARRCSRRSRSTT